MIALAQTAVAQAPADEMNAHYQKMMLYHLRMDPQVPAGMVVFLGDSLFQGYFLNVLTQRAVNYGIGSDTTTGLLARIPQYKSLERAGLIVLCIGVNDLRRRNDEEIIGNIEKILQALPDKAPVVVSAILPVDETEKAAFAGYNARIVAINKAIEKLCAARPDTRFVDPRKALEDESGNLAKSFHIGDGLHLSPAGYKIWTAALKPLVQEKAPSPSVD